MQPERAERIAELVEQAFELEGAQRMAFLGQACGERLGTAGRSGSPAAGRRTRRELDVLIGG